MDKPDQAEKGQEQIRAAIAKLQTEHDELKRKVHALRNRSYLSPEQQTELRTLQKMKLLKKDSITAMQAKL